MTRPTAPRGAMLGLATAVLLAACGAASPGSTAGPSTDAPGASSTPHNASSAPSSTPDAIPDATPDATPPASADPASEALASRPWATATLTDVTTGETFAIADFAGKPVFIEAMAIWCTNCRQQQGRFTEAFGQLQPGLAEYVVLTVDPSESAEDLARYRERQGFTGRYAVAGRELATALEAEFGPNVLNPPSVPLVFVSPAGEVSFSTGAESVQEIVDKAGA